MPLITMTVDGSVATLTLNDPDRRNAMTLDMCAEVETALDEVEANPEVKALVVTGAGRAFCAGADLTHLGDSAEEGRSRTSPAPRPPLLRCCSAKSWTAKKPSG